MHLDHVGTYSCFFQNFPGSRAGLSTEVSAGREERRGQATCWWLALRLLRAGHRGHPSPTSLEPCKVKTVIIHFTDKERKVQRGEVTCPKPVHSP